MSGIVFFATERLADVVEFYTERLGFEQWLDQPDCTILKYDNLLVGFCARDVADTDGIVTLVEPSTEAVDARYDELSAIARDPPERNERYEIYQFFTEDPEGRTIEIQAFLHPTGSV